MQKKYIYITVLVEHWNNMFFFSPGNQQKVCPGKLIHFLKRNFLLVKHIYKQNGGPISISFCL